MRRGSHGRYVSSAPAAGNAFQCERTDPRWQNGVGGGGKLVTLWFEAHQVRMASIGDPTAQACGRQAVGYCTG